MFMVAAYLDGRATYQHFQSIELNILSDPKDEASSTSSFRLQPKQYLVITVSVCNVNGHAL